MLQFRFPPDGILTSGRGKHDVDFESTLLSLEIEDHGFALTKAEEFNTMISGEDESSVLNGRLRPRKSTATIPNPPSKFSFRPETKVAQDKPKRNSSPSKASPNKQDDLTAKADSSSNAQFLCPFCDRKFSTKLSATKHARRIHLSASKQDKFINCLFCNYSGASSTDITRHMVDSHPNQYFACLECNTRFISTSELAEHKLNVCEKQKQAYRSKLRQKTSPVSKKDQKKIKADDDKSPVEIKEPTLEPEFNGLVISCELKPSLIPDHMVDIEDNITTNLILPSNINNPGMEKNAVIILDDIQWKKSMPPNFSFRNADADQILSRLGVVHRSPRVGETTRKEWLKLIDDSNQKFEKCFDTSFYSRVASNVQENLARFLDGSFNFSPDPDKVIKTRKSKSSAIINTAEGFPILLPHEQYSRNRFDGYMPRAIAPKHKWKWDSAENERNMIIDPSIIKRDNHVDNCIITLVSSLDIWTQLRMRHKFEGIFCKASTEKSEKQNIIGMQLKEILESREIPSTSRVVEYPSSSTAVVAVKESQEFPSFLGLSARGGSGDAAPVPAVLSGEWVRPRCYVCCACGEQTRESRALSAHMTAHHPNAQVQHYEIVGESLLNADILKHLYVPPSQMPNRTRPLRGFRDCTKCKKSVTVEDLHQHMLDCAGDTPTVRKKCRSRLFGVRRRRPRLPENTTTRKKLRKDLRTRHNQKTLLRARPKVRTEVGDAETIRKMIADLPAKRHRVSCEVAQQVLRPRRKLETPRNKLKIKRLASLERVTRKLTSKAEKTDLPIIDEDDQPLKPKTKFEPENEVPAKKRFSTRVLASRNKKETTTAKELPTSSNEKQQDVPSGSASQSNQLSRKSNTQRLNINKRGSDDGDGVNREGSEKNEDSDKRDKPSGDNHDKDNHKGVTPDPTLLKHSINNITASTSNKPLPLLKQSPEQSNTVGTSSDSRQTFLENEVGSSIIDKPPLRTNQKKTSEKKRLSLLSCIEKIKSQQKGETMYEQANLSLLDPHPAVISTTRDETGAATNVVPHNIEFSEDRNRYRRSLITNTQTMANQALVNVLTDPLYPKMTDLTYPPPKARSGRNRRKSSAVRVPPSHNEYDQATQMHYNHLMHQQQQWNAMHSATPPMMPLPLLAPPILPQRLPFSDTVLLQLQADEAMKNGYPMQYKNMGFPMGPPMLYNTTDLLYAGRRDHGFPLVEACAYPALPPISPQAWNRESAHMQPLNDEHVIPALLPPMHPSDNLVPTRRRSGHKRTSESTETDVLGNAQPIMIEYADPRYTPETNANLFVSPNSRESRDTSPYYTTNRPSTPKDNYYKRMPDYNNYTANNYKSSFENSNANNESVANEIEIYQRAQSHSNSVNNRYYVSPRAAEDRQPLHRPIHKGDDINIESHRDLVAKSLYSNNTTTRAYHERYLAEHPHLSPSVPTESQAAKITSSTTDSTIHKPYDMYTHIQNGEDNLQSVQVHSSTGLDGHTSYIEIRNVRDEAKALQSEPDSISNEQPLDLSGKSASANRARLNSYEHNKMNDMFTNIISQDTFESNNICEDVPTDLSIKDNRVPISSRNNHIRYDIEKHVPRIVEPNNAPPPTQSTINSSVSYETDNINNTIQIAESEAASSCNEVANVRNHDGPAFVSTINNEIESIALSTFLHTLLSLDSSSEISSQSSVDLLDKQIYLAQERIRLLESAKLSFDEGFKKNSEASINMYRKYIMNFNLLSKNYPQHLESIQKKVTADSTTVLPNSAPEPNNDNSTTSEEERKSKEAILASLDAETAKKMALFPRELVDLISSVPTGQHSRLVEVICKMILSNIAAAKSVSPEITVQSACQVKEPSATELTLTTTDVNTNSTDNKLTVNTAYLPMSSILPKKRHSPSARINSLEAQGIPSTNFNQASFTQKTVTGTYYINDDITRKLPEITIVEHKDEISDQMINLTDDTPNNATTTITAVEKPCELSIVNLTPKTQNATKHYNEQTASLRAVRIKTFPSARKSQSEDQLGVFKDHQQPISFNMGQTEINKTISNSVNVPISDGIRKIDECYTQQLIDAPNTKNNDETEVKLTESSDGDSIINKMFESNAGFETKVQSTQQYKSSEVYNHDPETTDKINLVTNKETNLLPDEHVFEEANKATETIKDEDTVNTTPENIDDNLINTSEPKSDVTHNVVVKLNIDSNSLPVSLYQDSLLSESETLCQTDTGEPAQESEMSKGNMKSFCFDNQNETINAEPKILDTAILQEKNMGITIERSNAADDSDDDICLAFMVKHKTIEEINALTKDSNTLINKNNAKHSKKNMKSKTKKSKKLKKTSVSTKLAEFPLNSAIFDKKQEVEMMVNEPNKLNDKYDKTTEDSNEIKTVKVSNESEINKENIKERKSDNQEKYNDNHEKDKPSQKEDCNDIYKNSLADNFNTPIEEIEEPHHSEDATEPLQEPSYIKDLNEKNILISSADVDLNVQSAKNIIAIKSDFTPGGELSYAVKNAKIKSLRRSKRGKSMFTDNIKTSYNNMEDEEDDLGQRSPVPEKQHIFSKLIPDENKHEEIVRNIGPSSTDDDNEIVPIAKISIKRKKSSRKSKNKKKKSHSKHSESSLDGLHYVCKISNIDTIVEKPSISSNKNHTGRGAADFDSIGVNTLPKQKRKSTLLFSDIENENVSKPKKSKHANQNEESFQPHQDSTTHDGTNTDMTEPSVDKAKESQKQSEKANTSAEIRTACYNRPINKLTNLISIRVKNPENYDPYDIDLDVDMAETTRPVVKRKGHRTVSGNNNTKTSKKNWIHGDTIDKIRNKPDTPKVTHVVSTPNDSDSSISDTPLQKYVEEKEKSKTESITSISELMNTTDDDNINLAELKLNDELNVTIDKGVSIPEINNEIENNPIVATNSIEQFDKINEDDINDIDSIVKDFITEQQKMNTIDNKNNDLIENVPETLTDKASTKNKKHSRSLSLGKNELTNVTNETDQQLSSDKYMENFGFYSVRKPRLSNLLASKKISETFNMIENDDADFRPRERQRKTSHNESKKSVTTDGAHTSKTTQEPNNSTDTNTSTSPKHTAEPDTVDETNKAGDDGEIDLITAQKMLESEEIRKLERDLYFGFKEAAEANAGKTSGFNFLRAEESRTENNNHMIAGTFNTNADMEIIESREPASTENIESEETFENAERPESPEIPESPEGILIDKPLMYPEEEVNIYEDKYDIIKRRREANANAKQLQKVDKPKKSNNGIKKKKPETKNKKNSKKPIFQVSQVPTKGALKGFDGIKISIPTQDLNLPPNVSPPQHVSKTQKQKESTEKARTYSGSSSKSDAGTSSAALSMPDIYEFQDDERPVTKGYRLSRPTGKSGDRSRSSSSEPEEKISKNKKSSLPYGDKHKSKKSDKSKERKYKGKGKGKGKRTRHDDDDSSDEAPRVLAKRNKKVKPIVDKEREKNKNPGLEKERTVNEPTLSDDNVLSNDNNASALGNDEPFYDSDIEMPNLPGTSGFVPDRNDESSYDSDSSSPPLSSVLKGPYACTCLSEIDSDDSETERGCAHSSCRYSHLSAAKNAVMGKIFKNNAVRCDKAHQSPKESPKPKPDLDRLFDSLLEPTSDVSNLPISGPSSVNTYFFTTQFKVQTDNLTLLLDKELAKMDSYDSPNKKEIERASMSSPQFDSDKSKIDDAFNFYNFSEKTEETSDNGRYVMVSEKHAQTEDPEQPAGPETFKDSADDVEPESSDFIVLKKKTTEEKSRGTQTKRPSDTETSSYEGDSNAAKLAKKNRKANTKHKSHQKRNKTSGKDLKERKRKSTCSKAAKSHSSRTKKVNDSTKSTTDTNARGRHSSLKPSTSGQSDEGISTGHDNSAVASESPREQETQSGIAEGRARRKCTVGKQNVLAEDWSSSESDAAAGAGPSRVKGKKSAAVRKSSRGKKENASKRTPPAEAEEAETEEVTRIPLWVIRARAAAEQHGWIVGQSHKKLVSMLAYSKVISQLRRRQMRHHQQKRRLRQKRQKKRKQLREQERRRRRQKTQRETNNGDDENNGDNENNGENDNA